MKILILGLLFPKELEYFPDGWQVKALPHPAIVSKGVFANAVTDFKPDVILFQFFGNRTHKVYNWGLKHIKARKVAWYIDSHVTGCREQEKAVQHLFDEICVTHSGHICHFTGKAKKRWLPCGLKAAPYQPQFAYYNLGRIPQMPAQHDVVFLFEPYGISEGPAPRESIVRAIKPELDKRKISYYIGQNRKQYVELMSSARVCLNISIANDLNIRNFEALALGKKLVTDKTPDHDKVPGLGQFCTYFQRRDKPVDIVNAIQRALEEPDNNSEERIDFAKKHCNIVRCIQMVNGKFEEVILGEA